MIMAQSKKLFLDAALAYSMCGPWAMRTHPTEHFSNGTGQIDRYTHYLNGLEAGATEYATKARKLVEALQECRHALSMCYNVTQWPADGDTQQDRAIVAADNAISEWKEQKEGEEV